MKTARELLESTPPSELENLVDGMSEHERRELSLELEGIAIRAAEFSAYIDMRYGSGCGDQKHKTAMKAFNRVRKAVRKAFGYNITTPIKL